MSVHLRRVIRSLIAVAALTLACVVAPAAAEAAPPPTPTSMTVVAQTDPAIAAQLAGVPSQALPSVLTAAGKPFQLVIALWIGSTPASYSTAMTVNLTASTGPGQLSVTQIVIPAGATGATVSESYSAATTSLQVTATTGTKKAPLIATTGAFPVEKNLAVFSGQSSSLTGGTAGADGAGCTTVTPAQPMCGILSLPKGANGSVALSLGLCPAGQPCSKGALVTQFIANMDGLYTRTAPAKMTIICDKSLCGQAGVNKFSAVWSQSATGALAVVQPCPSKGVIGASQNFCTDYVQSTRDNAGDLLLVVLFLNDLRGAVGG
ncbi:hypothetical protein [Microbacterium candidum]|uniref:Uncharacterized protein n=1 Tax=Microbacterium candidum TaxID=3041922 RepID=A0ABT7N2T9_9MICO|nr:hypothetical protein [Microbacterium sp. ASV49]MDL9981036.1 hypothetical protein [Microbacterium sp. ASV49]